MATATAAPLRLPPRPAPCPGRWLGLLGRYAAGNGASLLVAEQDGALQLHDGAYRPLREEGPDSFSLGDTVAAVFQRDSLGRGGTLLLGARRYARSLIPGERGERPAAVWQARNDSLWAAAQAAQPPRERGRFAKPDLVEIRSVEPGIWIAATSAEMTAGNTAPNVRRAWLNRPAARALARAHRRLAQLGYGIMVSDAYRPWYISKYAYLAAPPEQRRFYADPRRGSHHNRGTAVDVTLYELATGNEADMGYAQDELSERAASLYPGGTSLQRWRRQVLRTVLAAEGFRGLRKEWWHFRHIGKRPYRLMNVGLDELERRGTARP